KDADSTLFVQEALRQVARAGYVVANVDSTVILTEPKIGPYSIKIQARVAKLLGVRATQVGIKAKTPEGMGTDNTAIAHVVVLLAPRPAKPRRLRRAAWAAERSA